MRRGHPHPVLARIGQLYVRTASLLRVNRRQRLMLGAAPYVALQQTWYG